MTLHHGTNADCPKVQSGEWARCLGHSDDLRVVCAWCLKQIHPGVEPTSHGICPECVKRQFPDLSPTEPRHFEPRNLETDLREDR